MIPRSVRPTESCRTPSRPPARRVHESLLVFSDVHLGSDLNDGLRAGRPRRLSAIDRELVAFLEHYRAKEPPGGRWHIVVAGDFIDFVGMSIAPGEHEGELVTALTEEEREHGVGSAADHARLKLRRVARRHEEVFVALAKFVTEGHALTLVHGNHDIELHWDEVKDEFRSTLLAHAERDATRRGLTVDRVAFLERIAFNPWFFYREGVAYIEHGHQYDTFCSTAHVLAPISPLDPRRLVRGFNDVLLRYVVRRTRGMKEHGHEHMGVPDYLAFGARLGWSGMVKLIVRFTRAVLELFRARRVYVSETMAIARAEHEERVAKLAEAMRIGKDRIKALLALQAPPITQSIGGILRSVLLDRLALGMIALLAFFGCLAFGAVRGHGGLAALGVLVGWSLLHRHLARQRQVDPTEQLMDRARHLAHLFPAAFVVMGHTHVPTTTPVGQATYINLGAWAEDDDDLDEEETAAGPAPEPKPPAARASRTHLVIHVDGDRAEAQLCSWEADGPRPVPAATDA